MDMLSSYNNFCNKSKRFKSIIFEDHSIKGYSYWNRPETIRRITKIEWIYSISAYYVPRKAISGKRKIVPKLSKYKRKERYNII